MRFRDFAFIQLIAALLAFPGIADSQDFGIRIGVDTVDIAPRDAEIRFLSANAQLIAARLGIEAAQAARIQAELWSNPNIAIEQNVYNQFTKRYFDFTSTGNTEIQIQQMFLLAGKRDKQIKLAEINARIAEQTFFNVLRALKLELRSDLFDLYFLQQSLTFYDESLGRLKKTAEKVESIYQSRSILLSDALRLRSLLFSLETERQGLINRITDIEGNLHVLLTDSADKYYVADIDRIMLDGVHVNDIARENAIAAARDHRPDYKITAENVEYETTNLALQRSLAIPDLTLGGRWSRAGSYIPDYYALTLSIDLPVFNRNQGNIQVSEKTLEADRLLSDNARLTMENEVGAVYKKALDIDMRYRTFDTRFVGEYKTLIAGEIANYQSRNISVLEFTDFYESYRTSMVQWHQLQNDRADAIENLNYAVGTDIYKTQ